MRRVSKRITSNARALRREATPAERAMWLLLRRYRPAFTRQLSIDDRYIIDLANRAAKLAIEFDGSHHLDQGEYDRRRTDYLESRGWRVIRLWNSEVMENPNGAAEHILGVAAECLGGTHPQPLPSREGRSRKPRSRSPR